MAKVKNDIAAAALKLPSKFRAQLAEKLIYSLEEGGHTQNEKMWAGESLKRYEAMASGKVRGKSAAKVLRDIRAKLK